MRLWAQLRTGAALAGGWVAEHAAALLLPLVEFWHRFRIGQLWLMKVLMAPFFFLFGAVLLIDPSTFYESQAYFVMRAWASSQAWGLVAMTLAILMLSTPVENRYALKLLFFFASLYWASVAFTVATVNGFSGYTGILVILSVYSALIMARARVGDYLESRADV